MTLVAMRVFPHGHSRAVSSGATDTHAFAFRKSQRDCPQDKGECLRKATVCHSIAVPLRKLL